MVVRDMNLNREPRQVYSYAAPNVVVLHPNES